MVLRCCVPRCQNKGRFGFHKFPRDEGHCLKWQYVSRKRNISTKYLPYSAYRVCEKHFKADDYNFRFGKKRLNKTAIPNVYVPEMESVYEEHSYVISINGGKETLTDVKTATNIENEVKNTPTPYLEDIDRIDPKSHLKDVGPKVANDLKNNVKKSPARLFAGVVNNTNDNIKKERIPQYIYRQLQYKDNRIKFLQKKLKESTNLGQEKVIKYLGTRFNKDQMTFLTMQLRNAGKKNHGQRYTREEKVMMLAIYKRGPRAYGYLSLLFGLPSRRTLCRQSAELKFETGINTKLFGLIKLRASELGHLDRYCTIGWDETALTHHLTYCDIADYVDGFVDLGDVRIPDFATHSLTFMIRGINRAYKQPVAYFFTQSMTARDLTHIIVNVIRAVHGTGLKIVGSVCDQTGIMAAAVNRLINPLLDSIKQSGQLLTYEIDGNKIIHCFDPPHILKTIRNNLQTKNLQHFIDSAYDPDRKLDDYENVKRAVASWVDIKDFYDFDVKNSCRLLPKITHIHINPESEKMKVSNAAQVFSRSFGSILLFCSQKHLLPKDCSGTAYLLLFVNDVFDSLNGGGKPVPNTFRGCITENNKSKYFKFWEYAIFVLQRMAFIDVDTGLTNNRSSVLQKTISTIKGFMELTELCLSLGCQSVALRRMNQDGLENFFGSVRSVCYNPNAVIPPQFRSGYTTIILNNLTSKHSLAGNCEEDDDTSLLKNVYDLYDVDEVSAIDESKEIHATEASKQSNTDDDAVQLEIGIDQLSELKFVENDALALDSSSACKLVAASTNCQLCICTLEAYCPLSAHRIVTSLDSNIPVRTYPTLLFMTRFKLIYKAVETILPFISHERNLLKKLVSALGNIECNGLGCNEHKSEIAYELKKAAAKVCLTNYIRQLNCILRKENIDPTSNRSEMHQKAFDMVKKKKGIGKYGQKLL